METYGALAGSGGLSVESVVVIGESDLGHIEGSPGGPFADINTRVDGPKKTLNAAACLSFKLVRESCEKVMLCILKVGDDMFVLLRPATLDEFIELLRFERDQGPPVSGVLSHDFEESLRDD